LLAIYVSAISVQRDIKNKSMSDYEPSRPCPDEHEKLSFTIVIEKITDREDSY